MGYVRPKRAAWPANRPQWPSKSLRRRAKVARVFEISGGRTFDEHFFNGLLEDGDCIEVWSWPGPWNDISGRELRGRYELSIGRYLHLLEDLKSSGVNSCREVLAAIANKAIQATA